MGLPMKEPPGRGKGLSVYLPQYGSRQSQKKGIETVKNSAKGLLLSKPPPLPPPPQMLEGGAGKSVMGGVQSLAGAPSGLSAASRGVKKMLEAIRGESQREMALAQIGRAHV